MRKLITALIGLSLASSVLALPGDFYPGNKALPGPKLDWGPCRLGDVNRCYRALDYNMGRDASYDLRSALTDAYAQIQALQAQVSAISGGGNACVGTSVATPVISPAGGTFTSSALVTITSTDSTAVIRYTTDGSDPGTSSTIYGGSFTVNGSYTVKARGYVGTCAGAVASASFTITAAMAGAPTFSPAGGSYTAVQAVTMSSATTGAVIWYTTDGSAPSAGGGTSTRYTAAYQASSNVTLRAIAVASGYADSAVSSATYSFTFPVAVAPTFTPAAGSYGTAQSVVIDTTTRGAGQAQIIYSTDGGYNWAGGSAPVTVSVANTLTLSAYVTATGYRQSPTTVGVYTIAGVLPAVTLSVVPASGAVADGSTLTATALAGSDTPSISWCSTTYLGTCTPSTAYVGVLTIHPPQTFCLQASAPNHAPSGVQCPGYSLYSPPSGTAMAALGTNTGFAATWSQDLIYADAAKQGMYEGPLSPVDGWPSGDGNLQIVSDNPNVGTIAGTYAIRFIGTATLTGNECVVSGQTVASNVTDATLTVSEGQNCFVTFSNTRRVATDPAGTGVTSLTVMRPGLPRYLHIAGQESAEFNPKFLAAMAPFSVWRPMHSTAHPMDAGYSGETYWSDSDTPGATAWAANHAYTEGQYVKTSGGRSYRCMVAGTSGTTEPTTEAQWATDHNWIADGTVSWQRATRARPTTAYGNKGQPYEDLALWTQATGKAIWITIPFWATDTYIRKLAQGLRYGFDSTGEPYTTAQTSPAWPPVATGVPIYLEVGNELWNYGYPGRTWLTQLAGLASDPGYLKYQILSGDWGLQERMAAYMIVRASLLFRSVWGDAAMMTQVRPILTGWQFDYGDGTDVTTNDYYALRQALRYIQDVWGPTSPWATVGLYPGLSPGVTGSYGNPKQPVYYYVWGAAGAAYLHIDGVTYSATDTSAANLNTIFSGFATSLAVNKTRIDGSKHIAHQYGDIRIAFYETGTELTAWNAALTAAYADVRMHNLVNDLLSYEFNSTLPSPNPHGYSYTAAQVGPAMWHKLTGNDPMNVVPNFDTASLTGHVWTAMQDQAAALGGTTQIAAAPTFSPAGVGGYPATISSGDTITMSSTTPGAAISYCLGRGWSPTQQYNAGDVVVTGSTPSTTYRALLASLGTQPTEGTYWTVVPNNTVCVPGTAGSTVVLHPTPNWAIDVVAKATATGYQDSAVSFSSYQLPAAVAPTLTPGAGAVLVNTSVAFTSSTGSPIFYYCTGTSTCYPSRSSPTASSVTITGPMTVCAMTTSASTSDSAATCAAYTIATSMSASWSATPSPGNITNPASITVTTVPTGGAGYAASYCTTSLASCTPATSFTSGGTIAFTAPQTVCVRVVAANYTTAESCGSWTTSVGTNLIPAGPDIETVLPGSEGTFPTFTNVTGPTGAPALYGRNLAASASFSLWRQFGPSIDANQTQLPVNTPVTCSWWAKSSGTNTNGLHYQVSTIDWGASWAEDILVARTNWATQLASGDIGFGEGWRRITVTFTIPTNRASWMTVVAPFKTDNPAAVTTYGFKCESGSLATGTPASY